MGTGTIYFTVSFSNYKAHGEGRVLQLLSPLQTLCVMPRLSENKTHLRISTRSTSCKLLCLGNESLGWISPQLLQFVTRQRSLSVIGNFFRRTLCGLALAACVWICQ